MIASDSYIVGRRSIASAIIYDTEDIGYEAASDAADTLDQYSAVTVLYSPKSNSLNIPDNAQQIRKIKSFLDLEDNWDSYGAASIVTNCVHNAIDFVRRLDEKYQEVYFVAPGPNGEVLVELEAGERSIEVVFDEDKVEYVKYENGDAVDEGSYEPGDIDSQLVSWLRNAE